jgi:hypothetical protein
MPDPTPTRSACSPDTVRPQNRDRRRNCGNCWSNRNPLAAVALYPDRRFDYVLSAWPRVGGMGHPTHCELLGVVPDDQFQFSDHYGVLADLRY